MIVPSKKLEQFIESYPNRALLCEQLSIDESYLSRLLSKERSATRRVMEQFYRTFKWPLSDAWEIIEGDGDERD